MELSRAWAFSDQVNPDLRMTALQISAELGDRQTLPVALELADTASTPLRMRLSAIASVGQLGDSANRKQLEAYANEGNAYVRVAAKAALKRLKI